MPLEAPLPPVAERVAQLNERYRHHGAMAVLDRAFSDPMVGRLAMVSSFGAQSVVLLHMISLIDRNIPVLFLETGKLFPETLEYQVEVAEKLGLTDVRRLRPSEERLKVEDPYGALHLRDPDACCAVRKTEVLQKGLEHFDAWITGRKRYQTGDRTALQFFEVEDDVRIKVNPLAHWGAQEVRDYMINNRLPKHPLVAKGFKSIGCAPCTAPVAEGEDERAGRWKGQDKQECGIHVSGTGAVSRIRAAS